MCNGAVRDRYNIGKDCSGTAYSLHHRQLCPDDSCLSWHEQKNSGPLVMREPEFFDYVSSLDDANVVAMSLDERVGGVFWIAAWLLVACGTALTDAVFDALTDGFVNVLPVLDSVGQHRFDHGFQSTGNGVD